MKKQAKRFLVLLLTVFLVSVTAQPALAASAVKSPVVTQVQYKAHSSDGNNVVKFARNKYGLVTKKVTFGPDGTVQLKVVYAYNAKGLVKSATISEFGSKMAAVAYTYNSANQLTKRVTKFANANLTITAKYAWKNGRVSKSVTTYSGDSYYPDGTKITETYNYNSKGNLSWKDIVNSKDPKASGYDKFAYDKNGYATKVVYKTGYANGQGSCVRKYVYKNGRPVKYRDTDYSNGETYPDTVRTITWKTVSIPNTFAKIVGEQQKEIINGYSTQTLYLWLDY